MNVTLYGLKTCDTCRKARKALDAADVDVVFHDVRDDGVSNDLLAGWIAAAGWEALLNTRSTTWRELSGADKKDVDAAKAARLMLAHPTLIKRPVIDADGEILVGWTKDAQYKLGL